MPRPSHAATTPRVIPAIPATVVGPSSPSRSERAVGTPRGRSRRSRSGGGSGRRRATTDGVAWHLPNPKVPGTFSARPFAYTTPATAFLIEVLAEDGLTWSEIAKVCIYDHDARHVALGFIAAGHASTPVAEHVHTPSRSRP